MAESRKIVKVFLASPGDLAEERTAAKAVVDDFNSLTADDLGYQVELVGWEDTVSVYGRPQATINMELGRCELFIGMMWKKWGTAPDVAGPYSSGFEEEYELSVARRTTEGKPEISLYFKTVGPEFLVDPGDDLKRVINFRERLIAEKKIYYEQFSDVRELEKKIMRCIWAYVKKLRMQDAGLISAKSQPPAVEQEEGPQTGNTVSGAETPLSKEGASFLRRLISKTESTNEENFDELIPAVDIARFRLLSNILKKSGNDERNLGVHDANLLFGDRNNSKLGGVEVRELVATGLRHFKDENTPLWYWIAEMKGFSNQILLSFSIVNPKRSRVGAIDAMRRIAELLPSDGRDSFIAAWLTSDSDGETKVSALKYLGEFGIVEDLRAIQQEFDRSDNKTAGPAAEAIVRIRLRESREKAIEALYVLQSASIDKRLLEEVFANAHGLSTDMLNGGIGHINADVRLPIVKALRTRGALSSELAEQLLADSDLDVRYEALMTLVDGGRQFSIPEAKKILSKAREQSRWPLSSLFSSYGSGRDAEAEHYVERFSEQRLRSMKDRELRELVDDDSMFDRPVWFVLAERHPVEFAQVIRERLDDLWESQFARDTQDMIDRHGESSRTVENIRSVAKYTRKGLTRKTLDLVCKVGRPQDLGRVRAVLRSGFVDYSHSEVEYLRKFGEWEDIPLIIDATKRPNASSNPLRIWSELDDSKYRFAAKVVYELGRTRFRELVGIPMPAELMIQVLVQSSEKSFKSLSDASILTLLHAESDSLRKATALKCGRSLSKRRVSQLLHLYTDGSSYRYYNVVHWLDLFMSAPRELAIRAAERTMKELWHSNW